MAPPGERTLQQQLQQASTTATAVECPVTMPQVETWTWQQSREKKHKQDISNFARLPELVATELRIFAAAVQQLIMYET